MLLNLETIPAVYQNYFLETIGLLHCRKPPTGFASKNLKNRLKGFVFLAMALPWQPLPEKFFYGTIL